jgi:uncharacterized membrane protein YhaH (DUF805 family)
MSISKLFLSFEGRIGRLQFWLATVIVEGAAWAVQWATRLPSEIDWGAVGPSVAVLVIELTAMYPEAAIAVKRLHDRNRPGAYVWALLAAATVFRVADFLGYVTHDPVHSNFAQWVFMLAVGVVLLTFLIELGFKRGTPGPNRYGTGPA